VFFLSLPLRTTKVPELNSSNTLHDMMLFKWLEISEKHIGDLPHAFDFLLYELSIIYRESCLIFSKKLTNITCTNIYDRIAMYLGKKQN